MEFRCSNGPFPFSRSCAGNVEGLGQAPYFSGTMSQCSSMVVGGANPSFVDPMQDLVHRREGRGGLEQPTSFPCVPNNTSNRSQKWYSGGEKKREATPSGHEFQSRALWVVIKVGIQATLELP